METSLTPNGCGRSSGVEHYLAKVRVVSSNLIARSNFSWSTCCLPRIGPSLCARLDFARKSRVFCERVRGSSRHVPRPHPDEEQIRRANTSRTEGGPLRIKYSGWLRMSRRGIAAVRARLWRRSTLIGFAALCNTPCKSGVWKRSSYFRSREPLSPRHVTQLREDREIFHGELRRRLSRIPVRQAASSRPSLRAGTAGSRWSPPSISSQNRGRADLPSPATPRQRLRRGDPARGRGLRRTRRSVSKTGRRTAPRPRRQRSSSAAARLLERLRTCRSLSKDVGKNLDIQ